MTYRFDNSTKTATFKVNGEEFKLKGTFQCLKDIEIETGLGVQEFVKVVQDGKLKLMHVVAIVKNGMKAAGTGVTEAFVGEVIMSNGLTQFMHPAAMFYIECLAGPEPAIEGDEGEGKPKEA